MKRLLVPAALLAALAVPTGAMAAPAPSKADRAEAKRECRALKDAAETQRNFASVVALERKTSTRNATTQCRKERAADARSERTSARRAAFEACRAEHKGPRTTRGRKEQPNAFGKCISAAAKAHNGQADAEQRERSLNPAKACRAEQEASSEQFAAAYGTKRNAFGKCVSAKAKAQNEDEPQA